MQLIADSPPDRRPPEVEDALQQLPDLSLFRVVAHADRAFGTWLAHGSTLLTALELGPAVREVAILQLARTERCEYEWDQHVAIGRAVGVAEAHVEAIGDGTAESLPGDLAIAARAAREFAAAGGVTESTMSALSGSLGARQTVELLLVLGHYLAIARLVASVGLAPDRADHISVTHPRESS